MRKRNVALVAACAAVAAGTYGIWAEPVSKAVVGAIPIEAEETSLPTHLREALSSASPTKPAAKAGTPAGSSTTGLRVAEPRSMTGYERDKFGPAWSDDVDVAGGHNGCDTRNDTLRSQLRQIQVKPNTRGCVVLTGVLADPYTGKTIEFRRGGGRQLVDVDHRVALADAWRHGAASWTPQKRQDFANDPRNLVAVSAGPNRSKGDKSAAEWLPTASQCEYVRRQIAVKRLYGLTVSSAEHRAMHTTLTGCQEG